MDWSFVRICEIEYKIFNTQNALSKSVFGS